MSPCSNWKERLALHAAGVGEETGRQTLESHVATCPGCRAYLREMTALCHQQVEAVRTVPPVEVSGAWRRRLRRRLHSHAEATDSIVSLGAAVRSVFRAWARRLAVPTTLAIAAGFLLVLGVVFGVVRRPGTERLNPAPMARQDSAPTPPPIPTRIPSPTPTLLAYQRALRASPEALDALLSEEADAEAEAKAASPPRPLPHLVAAWRNPAGLTD